MNEILLWRHSDRVGFSDNHVFGYVAGGASWEMPGYGSVQVGAPAIVLGKRF